jgi:hypothetical protein
MDRGTTSKPHKTINKTMEVMNKKDPKKIKQKKLEELTPQERMDIEKAVTWFYKLYQQKGG